VFINMKINVPEEYWTVSLNELPQRELESVLDLYRESFEVGVLQRSESGLDLLEIEDSVLNESFFLGEIAVSQCQLEVTHRDSGLEVLGYCKVMEDSTSQASSLALADAMLRMEVDFPELEMALEDGYRKWKERLDARKLLLAKTQIKFSLL